MTSPIRLLLIIGCSLGCTLLSAENTGTTAGEWRPHEHPASFHRQIVAFTEATHLLDLTVEVSARVQAVHVDVGHVIGADTAVLELDPRFAELARQRAAAAVTTATSRLTLTDADIALAQRELNFRQQEVDRIVDLVQAKRIEASQMDRRLFDRDRLKLQITQLQARRSIEQAQLAETQAVEAEAAERLKRHTLTAPTGWIVTDRLVQAGTSVVAGQAVLRLAYVDTLALRLRLSEEEIAALPADGSLPIKFHNNGQQAVAQHFSTSPRFDPISKKRLVEFRLPAQQAPAASGGLRVNITIPLRDPTGAITIPKNFATERLEQVFITIRQSDGATRSIPIRPLRSTDTSYIISAQSLPAGTVVITPQGK